MLAGVRAVLKHLKAQGPALQERIAERAADLAEGLNGIFARHGLKAKVERYSSFLYFSLHADGPLAGLLFYHLRDRGIYAQDGFPLFLNAAHTDEDIAQIVAAFDDSLDEMARAGIIGGVETASAAAETAADLASAVVPLTESQTEIWLSAQNGDEASCAFNESVTLRLNGPLDHAALRTAMERIMARHDALRARFSATGETMTISPDTSFPCPITDAAQGDGSPDEHPERVFAGGRVDAVRPGRRAADPGAAVQAVRDGARAGADRPSHHLRRLVDQRHRHGTGGDLCEPARTAATRSRAGPAVQRVRTGEVGARSRRTGRRLRPTGRRSSQLRRDRSTCRRTGRGRR